MAYKRYLREYKRAIENVEKMVGNLSKQVSTAQPATSGAAVAKTFGQLITITDEIRARALGVRLEADRPTPCGA